MWQLAMLATEYAPGHNFWPGSRFSWYVRGGLMFLIITAPVVITWYLLRQIARGKISRWWSLLAAATFLFAWNAFAFSYRDGDKPAFIGATWGTRVAPWLAVSGVLYFPAAYLLQRRSNSLQRGFDVIVPDHRESKR